MRQIAVLTTRHTSTNNYCTTSRQWRLLFSSVTMDDNARTFLYRFCLKIQLFEQNKSFVVWFQQWCLCTTMYLDSRGVWKQCCSSTIWGTVLKYMCIYNSCDTWCIQCILQGPWVKPDWDNCPRVQKLSAEHHNTTCTSSVDFFKIDR